MPAVFTLSCSLLSYFNVAPDGMFNVWNFTQSSKLIEYEMTGILTQRGMLHLKDVNIIVYSDGVGHKVFTFTGGMLHPILLQKS